MNDIKIYENAEFGSVRTLEVNGEPYFVGKDVAEILGYTNVNKAIQMHVDEEDKKTLDFKGFSHFGTSLWSGNDFSNKTIINESGLYSLILSSKLPKAKEFKHWVTSEVLPSIRKTGSYAIPKNGDSADKSKAVDAKLMNAKVRMSNQFLKLANVDTLSTQYKSILVAKAAEVLSGEKILPMPQSEQKMYTATEIGAMFGVSAQKIGSISNKHGMKTEEFGEWYRDKSRYSCKEVDSFKYNDKAVEKFKELLRQKGE